MNRTYLCNSMWQITDRSLLFNLGKLREMIELLQYFLKKLPSSTLHVRKKQVFDLHYFYFLFHIFLFITTHMLKLNELILILNRSRLAERVGSVGRHSTCILAFIFPAQYLIVVNWRTVCNSGISCMLIKISQIQKLTIESLSRIN